MNGRLRALVLLGFCFAGAARAGWAAGDEPSARSDLKGISRDEYVDQIGQMQALVASCKARAEACDPAKVVEDASVDLGASKFDARRAWLRDALAEAKKGPELIRVNVMTRASERLAADAAEVDAVGGGSGASLQDARSKADVVLDRTEFRAVAQDHYAMQQWARLAMAIDEFFDRAARHLPQAPWMVLAIEWTVLGGAAAGLLIWAWRTTRQQRLALAAPSETRQAVWQRESDDWARRAEAEAAKGEWREAVHCLYWAAIVMLEGRRMWRANRARTPREYLPLLEAGSARQRALGGLTRIFERIWYGLRAADKKDFERAQALLEELKAA